YDADSVAVVVQDHGHGMSPEDAQRVFDRFWRADPSRPRTIGGTGLGPSISAEDAHLHEGWLQAWGQAGEGAVFRLTIPRRPGHVLVRSPLPLERSFDLAEAVAAASATPTGEIRVGPEVLPDLDESPEDRATGSGTEGERGDPHDETFCGRPGPPRCSVWERPARASPPPRPSPAAP